LHSLFLLQEQALPTLTLTLTVCTCPFLSTNHHGYSAHGRQD